MKILKRNITPKGENIQIEDWAGSYSFMKHAATIGAYPTATRDSGRIFGPRKGETFRMQLNFKNKQEAAAAFADLATGTRTLEDLERYFNNRIDILLI